MTQSIPPGYAAVGIQFTNTGDPDPWYITFGLDISDAGGDTQGVADKVSSAWYDNLLPYMNPSTRMTGVQLKVGTDGGDPLTTFWPYNVPGSSSAAKLPSNCALLVTKVTDRPGRTGKGRIFVPNILSEGDVDQVGSIASGTITEFQGFFDDFISQLEGGGDVGPLPAVLLHSVGSPGSSLPTPITAWVVQGVIATQRRRLR